MSSRIVRAATSLSILICASGAFAQSAFVSPAEALLRRVVATYRSAKTYSDVGSTSYGSTWTNDHRLTASFEIRFARPASLRFELVDHLPYGDHRRRHTVWWSDEQANQIWSSLSNRFESLAADDLYRSRWDSGAPAYHIPTLLNPRFANRYFLDIAKLPSPAIVAEETFQDFKCYHLTASNGAATPDLSYDLWIGKDDLLVHRFAFRRGAFSYEEIHRNIQLDTDLPPDTFRISPPG
jgi:outer membrane lipoprotein-sorting protein